MFLCEKNHREGKSRLEKAFPSIIRVLTEVEAMEAKMENSSVISSSRKLSQSNSFIHAKI